MLSHIKYLYAKVKAFFWTVHDWYSHNALDMSYKCRQVTFKTLAGWYIHL